MASMNQKSSVAQTPNSVRWALTSDITELIVGVSMQRTDEQWILDYRTLKTGAEIRFPIDRRITKLLDQAVLFSTNDQYFADLYQNRIGTPFFVKNMHFERLSKGWPSKRTAILLGCGTHIARTLWFETEFERNAGNLGAATAICGHRSQSTAKHYLTVRSREQAASEASDVLANVAEASKT